MSVKLNLKGGLAILFGSLSDTHVDGASRKPSSIILRLCERSRRDLTQSPLTKQLRRQFALTERCKVIEAVGVTKKSFWLFFLVLSLAASGACNGSQLPGASHSDGTLWVAGNDSIEIGVNRTTGLIERLRDKVSQVDYCNQNVKNATSDTDGNQGLHLPRHGKATVILLRLKG